MPLWDLSFPNFYGQWLVSCRPGPNVHANFPSIFDICNANAVCYRGAAYIPWIQICFSSEIGQSFQLNLWLVSCLITTLPLFFYYLKQFTIFYIVNHETGFLIYISRLLWLFIFLTSRTCTRKQHPTQTSGSSFSLQWELRDTAWIHVVDGM